MKNIKDVWIFSTTIMAILSFFLIIPIACSEKKPSEKSYSLNKNPANDTTFSFVFEENEDLCVISTEQNRLRWETDQNFPYTFNYPNDAIVLDMSGDYGIIKCSNGKVITVLVDRRIFTDRALTAIAKGVEKFIQQYANQNLSQKENSEILEKIKRETLIESGFSGLTDEKNYITK